MSSSAAPLWWDRDADRTGKPIRPDVRAAGHAIWGTACKRAQTLISDCSQAADVMEASVAQVSRYLDRAQVAVFSRQIEGLLMLSFQRSLQRRVSKLKRLESLGGTSELSTRAIDHKWTSQTHARLQLDQVVRLLSERSRTVLALRYAGYTWKETAQLMGDSVVALRSAFWRDVARVKRKLNGRGVPSGASFQFRRNAACNTY
jgi:DNA-directed RNA polymerase specialized sigma24 family protein